MSTADLKGLHEISAELGLIISRLWRFGGRRGLVDLEDSLFALEDLVQDLDTFAKNLAGVED